MTRRNTRAMLVAALSLAVFNAGFAPTALADIVDTGTLVQTARDTHLASIHAQLAREEVRTQLTRHGVDAAAIDSRLAAMSDRELAALAERMDSVPAGGDGLLAVVGITFVVLVILELVGVINIFNRA